jgi:hypothetical protein
MHIIAYFKGFVTINAYFGDFEAKNASKIDFFQLKQTKKTGFPQINFETFETKTFFFFNTQVLIKKAVILKTDKSVTLQHFLNLPHSKFLKLKGIQDVQFCVYFSFLSAYFNVLNAYFGTFKHIFACIFLSF